MFYALTKHLLSHIKGIIYLIGLGSGILVQQ